MIEFFISLRLILYTSTDISHYFIIVYKLIIRENRIIVLFLYFDVLKAKGFWGFGEIGERL